MSRVCLGGAVVAGCAMPRTQLPIFPASSCAITPEHAFEQRDGSGVYFNGHLPVFAHPAADLAAFRLFSSQLIANGAATQVQITRAFAVPLVTVKRACKKLRQEGAAGCFRPPVPRQGHRLTAAVLAEAQALLDAGLAPAAVAARLGVLPNTLNKSMHAGRLKKDRAAGVADPVSDPRGSSADAAAAAAAAAAPAPAATPSTQSARSVATTRSLERVAAALGVLEEAPLPAPRRARPAE